MNNKTYLKKSDIHGMGIFAKHNINKNSRIGVAINYYLGIIPHITPEFGTMINHSYTPNSRLKYNDNKQVYQLVANVNIPKDAEITLDYRKTPWYIMGPETHYS